jgi:hypothetical protein
MKTPHLDLAAVEDQAAARLETLARFRHWYDVTKNPLYVWEAVARCLYDNPPTIPEWRLDYLRATASNLFDLSRRKDFRDSESTAFQLTDPRIGSAGSLSFQKGQEE